LSYLYDADNEHPKWRRPPPIVAFIYQSFTITVSNINTNRTWRYNKFHILAESILKRETPFWTLYLWKKALGNTYIGAYTPVTRQQALKQYNNHC
jgi:hypothetical protein